MLTPAGASVARLTVGLGTALLLSTLIAAAAVAQEPAASPGAPASAAASGEVAFPTTLAGALLERRTFSGPDWLAESSTNSPEEKAYAEQMRALVESLGRSIDDLTVTTALAEPSEGNQAVIAAVRIAGTEPRAWIRDMAPLLLGDIQDPSLLMRPLGGRWVLRVVDAAMPGVYPRTVYLAGDTAWVIGGDEEHVLDLLSQLPAAPGPSSPEEGEGAAEVAQQLPSVLGGQRRAGLYEAVEPLFLPTLSERIGPPLEGWLLDLYLDEGISPTDIVGAVAWWGLEAAEEGIEVEGYHAPGASEAMVQRLLEEVVLSGGEAGAEEVGRAEEEVGGHAVTTIDSGGGTRRHVFASDGTVWIVTDHVGQPELAAEAVASLP
jgi:hypothetical protein